MDGRGPGFAHAKMRPSAKGGQATLYPTAVIGDQAA
jgi:hypothetical protein